MTDEKTPGDGTHELRLPERPGTGGSTPSTPDPASPPKPAEGFTWGLRPRGPDRTSAPPTAAIVLPSFVQPELPTRAGSNDSARNDSAQNSSAPNNIASNDSAPNGTGSPAPATPGVRRAPASSRRARVTEPSEPPPLVEPPRVKRTVSAAELATQAMSLEEILAAQEARPITRETWSRPIPTQTGRPQDGRAARARQASPAAGESADSTSHSRRSHLPQTHASAEAEAAAITSLPAAIAPGATTGTHASPAAVGGTATAASTGMSSSSSAASSASAADPELSTQALSAQDVREAETPRYRPRRAHLPEGVHDRNPAPADVVVAPTFRQAEAANALPQLPPARGAANTRGTTNRGITRSAVSPGMPHGQKVLLWIAGSLVMVLVLVAVYLLASRLGEQSVADNQNAGEAVDADPTPVLTGDEAPVAPGVHDWTELAGGECLTGFDSAWAEEFTVVDCAEEHTAQVLTRAELSAGPDAPFPGADTLTTDVGVLCGLPAVLNYGEAASVSDIQVSSSHPVDAADWSTGNRTYFCFVDRASGEPLPGDLQVVPAA